VALRIEDYALIGDLHTAALVGRDGSLDWLCLPRFDSPACFAALLGSEKNGRWQIAPAGHVRDTKRRYRGETLVLETEFETDDGAVRLVDCMPVRRDVPRVVRVVEGVRGSVTMQMTMTVRFDYGHTTPWVSGGDDWLTALAGPDALDLSCDVPLERQDPATAEFVVAAGQRVAFVATWHPSHEPSPPPIDAVAALAETDAWWREWSARSAYQGQWSDEVMRSLLTLKALTYEPTGGIVAAPTTSLPEFLGGARNWDYRYCWLRDAALTLDAFMAAGYAQEATRWRDWLLRAVAGDPEDLQIMYGLGGERRLDEYELPWLAGYEGSRPVRVGNAAAGQLQLDVYGEAVDAVYKAQQLGMATRPQGIEMGLRVMEWLESHWREPDDGLWEMRGPRRHFVHSKVMAWVAADRAVRIFEAIGAQEHLERFRRVREEIHAEVCREGFDSERNTFTQSYGSKRLDAALLLIPQVGFLLRSDPRAVGTVEAVHKELMQDGFVMRYIPDEQAADGLPPGEGAFLACSFWLVDALALIGRRDEALALFERLLSLRNEVGLFSEEYDQRAGRLIGNFPQAFTHLALISSAATLSGRAVRRAGAAPDTLAGGAQANVR
jgi:GH15 family glucan-1,4-alpha-glucosidase